MDRIFDGVADGTIPMTGLGPATGPQNLADRVLYPPHLKTDHAETLEALTDLVEVARRPPEQWPSGLKGVKFPPQDRRHLVSKGVLPAVNLIIEAAVRDQATLRTAILALGCERHRRAFGAWPATLADLPAEFRPAPTTDPFDGQPLRYRRLPDGVVIYSIGADGKDDGGVTVRKPGLATPPDVGFRLWDTAHRRAEPPSTVEVPE
jgi:hypothetical protein